MGLAWDVKGNGKNVVRAGFGLYYGQPTNSASYQATYFDQPTLFFSQTYTNSVIGSGQLANYVYGVSPLPANPVAATELPAVTAKSGLWSLLKSAITIAGAPAETFCG